MEIQKGDYVRLTLGPSYLPSNIAGEVIRVGKHKVLVRMFIGLHKLKRFNTINVIKVEPEELI